MVDLAERLGAERLLTGHYARIVEDADGPLLAAAADQAKDQSYMLAALPPELLGRLGFPLTELTKPEVREIAARHGLAVARKAESQDLCFLAGQGKRGFLRRHGGLRERDGAILDSRRPRRSAATAATTTSPSASAAASASRRREPLYVLATDAAANTVTVGTRAELEQRSVRVRDAVLHRDGERGRRGQAALPLARPPGHRRGGADAGATRPSRSSWARPSPASPRARRRCSGRRARSSATAPSPPRTRRSGDRARRHRRRFCPSAAARRL